MKTFLCRLSSGEQETFQSYGNVHLWDGLQVMLRGYFTNRQNLLRETGLKPDAEDARLAAVAYRRWGTGMTQHLLGEYAVVMYDSSKRSLLMAHDELGLVPLYYAEMSGHGAHNKSDGPVIYAGAFLEDVIAETGIGDIDQEFIADYIALGQHLGRGTPYTHIKRLLPGECLVWTAGVLTRHSTWTVTAGKLSHERNAADIDEEFRCILQTGIAGSLPEKGKAWCELSGGLDSSTVLAFAAQVRPDVEAVSFLSTLREADERHWMKLVLEKYPAITWNTLDGDRPQPFSELPQGPIGQPNAASLSAGIHRVYWERLSEHGVDTVLTGQAGDAVFLGMGTGPYYLADMLNRGKWSSMWSHLKKWQREPEYPRPLRYWFHRYAWGPALRHRRREMVENFMVRRDPIPWVAPEFAASWHLRDRTRKAFTPRMESIAATNLMEGMLRCANSAANYYHRPQARADFRHPLFYLPLLKLTLSIPAEQTVQPQTDRVVQRRALTGILPAETLRRRDKCGADQNYYEGLDSGNEWLGMLTQQPEIVQRGYVAEQSWLEGLRQARLGGNVELRYLVAFASLEVWLRGLKEFRRQKWFLDT